MYSVEVIATAYQRGITGTEATLAGRQIVVVKDCHFLTAVRELTDEEAEGRPSSMTTTPLAGWHEAG